MTVKFDSNAPESEQRKRALFYGEEDAWIGSPYLKLLGDLASAVQTYIDSHLGNKRYTVVVSRLDNRVGLIDEWGYDSSGDRVGELLSDYEFDPVRLTSEGSEKFVERYLPQLKEVVRRLQERE